MKESNKYLTSLILYAFVINGCAKNKSDSELTASISKKTDIFLELKCLAQPETKGGVSLFLHQISEKDDTWDLIINNFFDQNSTDDNSKQKNWQRFLATVGESTNPQFSRFEFEKGFFDVQFFFRQRKTIGKLLINQSPEIPLACTPVLGSPHPRGGVSN